MILRGFSLKESTGFWRVNECELDSLYSTIAKFFLFVGTKIIYICILFCSLDNDTRQFGWICLGETPLTEMEKQESNFPYQSF